MTQSPRPTALAGDPIEEYLADREGLSGSPRGYFLEILRRYGGFRAIEPSRNWRAILLASLLAALIGIYFDSMSAAWSGIAVWSGCFLLTIGPIYSIRQQEQRLAALNCETEWRAYCLFLRPIILTDHPGLLDRNLPSGIDAFERADFRPIPLLRRLLQARSIDFWWSCVLGIWLNMLVLMVARRIYDNPSHLWSVLPTLGFLTGPLLDTLWRALIFYLAKPNADDG